MIINRVRAEMAVSYGILHGKSPDQIVDMLDTDGLLMPDLPEPKIDSDGWAEWDTEYVIEAQYHPDKGLWTYDDGRMVPDSPDRLREVAYIYLAAADYAERNQE